MIQRVKKFLFQNTSTKQTVAKNTFWLFLGEMAGRVLKLVLVIYAARILGADGWGVFSYALSLSSLIMIFSDIGLTGLITRELSKKKGDYTNFISNALVLKSILLIISAILVIILGPSLSHITGATILFPLFGIVLFFDGARDLVLGINLAHEKMEKDMIVKTIMNSTILILGVFFLYRYVSPVSIALAYAIGSALGCILAIILIRKDLRGLFSNSNWITIRKILQITWPFTIVTLLGIVMTNIDIYMLGIWRTPTEIGFYSSAQRIQQFITIIPIMLATAVFPVLSRLAQTDDKQFVTILEKVLSLIFLVGIPIVCGGYILSRKIMIFSFGVEFAGASAILQIFMLTLLVSLPLVMLSNALFAYNKQRYVAIAYVSGLAINGVLNLLLIPTYGAIGAAIATLVSTSVITAIIWINLRKIQYFEILSKLKKLFIATTAMFGVVLLLQKDLHVLLIIAIALVVYIGTLLFTKEPLLLEAKSLLAPKSLS